MNRRFFKRIDVKANGELLWATRSRLGKVKNVREYITTTNISIDGARIAIPGHHQFPDGAHARFKLGIQFCEVEVLEADTKSMPNYTIARLLFLSPDRRFVAVVEKYLPVATDERDEFISNWV